MSDFYIALKDNPGPCPGPDWQLLASWVRDWEIDRTRYVITPIMSDGSKGPPLELRALFEQFLLEPPTRARSRCSEVQKSGSTRFWRPSDERSK
jgi:hypothetical protein